MIKPYYEESSGKIYLGDCLDVMKEIPDKSVDLVLTSPPYDNLRNYEGYSFNFEEVAKELFRIIKDGGVMVWVVGDATINGSETGTSFKQALYFKEIGFNLHDTMIWEKDSPVNPSHNRYNQIFEYIFVFSKENIKTFNLIKDRKNKYKKSLSSTRRNKDGILTKKGDYYFGEMGTRNNIWRISCGYMKSTKDKIAYEHPATFPDKLAEDNIISWSNENDLVLDPFNGSGTTTKMAKYLGRNFIGIEISEKYCEIAKNRLKQNLLPF